MVLKFYMYNTYWIILKFKYILYKENEEIETYTVNHIK